MIRTQGLTKRFGEHHALKGIDLHVEEGDLFGFIGPNGAGKTTTIRILTTLLEPTSGDATIGGFSVWKSKLEIRSMLGYMPDDFGVYRDMTVSEYLHFFAAAYGIPPKERIGLVGGLLELVDLTVKEHALVDTLSRGMQQRLGLARTLVHDPKVLVLDEPASGLDPRARIEIREILKELRSMGKTILLSSHILSELAEVCNRVAVLEQGQLVAQGQLADILDQARDGTQIDLRTTDDARACVVLRELPMVERAEIDEPARKIRVQLARPMDLAEMAAHLHARDLHLRMLAEREPTLEQVFMKLTQGLVQ
ncbi:MAG: ABC transporter ATP-binding protein [Deltaproteobacteria bacterium]|nr:MAG: ABC transporter ATP-binding protein [Deltaproteobacteria bacterium]